MTSVNAHDASVHMLNAALLWLQVCKDQRLMHAVQQGHLTYTVSTFADHSSSHTPSQLQQGR